MSGAIPPLPNTPSWRCAQLKRRDNFTFTLLVITTVLPCLESIKRCMIRELESLWHVLSYQFRLQSRNSSVSIVTGLWAGRSGFDSRHGLGIFSLRYRAKAILGLTQPPIEWIPGIKRPGRQTDHSLPSRADVKNAWRYTSTPPIRLHCVVLS
jgi:hypothetical protein